MNWRTSDEYGPRREDAAPEFHQTGMFHGRLITATAMYDVVWTSTFRIYRIQKRPGPIRLMCQFDLTQYPDVDPALMTVWTATEWLYLLEDVLPLDPLPD